MHYRFFRHTSTGQYSDRRDGTSALPFAETDAEAIANLAAHTGVPGSDIVASVVEQERPEDGSTPLPPDGGLWKQPTASPLPPTEQEQATDALLALDPSAIADPAAREFLTKMRDLVAGHPTVMEQAAANVTRGIP